MADRNEYLEDPMWYVVHTYSGYENKVKTNIDKSIQNLHLEDQILDVQVPVQEVIEVKDGKKKTVQKKLFPGYVLLTVHDLGHGQWEGNPRHYHNFQEVR